MTAKRTRKLFRRKMWAVVDCDIPTLHEKRSMAYRCRGYAWRTKKRYDPRHPSDCIPYRVGRVARVLVSEIPKPSPRKKVRRGK